MSQRSGAQTAPKRDEMSHRSGAQTAPKHGHSKSGGRSVGGRSKAATCAPAISNKKQPKQSHGSFPPRSNGRPSNGDEHPIEHPLQPVPLSVETTTGDHLNSNRSGAGLVSLGADSPSNSTIQTETVRPLQTLPRRSPRGHSGSNKFARINPLDENTAY